MKIRFAIYTTFVIVMTLFQGCGDGGNKPTSSIGASVPAPPPKPHNYEVRDGMEYGYSAAISKDAQNSGQIAPRLIMFKYAGQRDGKHQVHTTDGVTFTAIECSAPCEVIKVMSFMTNEYLRDTVHVERMKNQPGSIGSLVMEDAITGKLNPYGLERGKQRFQIWVEDQKGYREHLIKEAGR